MKVYRGVPTIPIKVSKITVNENIFPMSSDGTSLDSTERIIGVITPPIQRIIPAKTSYVKYICKKKTLFCRALTYVNLRIVLCKSHHKITDNQIGKS